VALVVRDRFPYGYAVMIETGLDSLPEDWLERLQAPTAAPTLGPHPSLTCPQVDPPLSWDEARRSLYLLYAHMLEPIPLDLGEIVACGEKLGVIGQSGNALNPHLHLEARIGPAGARFNSMAHYSGGITQEEMRNYCAWRVSGVFQLLDPMRVLELLP
jgi:murein DD-endopeptidase MepM/ murein hydrolase activator NlpD